MNDKNHPSFTDHYSRMEMYALLLGEIRNYALGKKGNFQPQDIPEILMDFIRNESMLLTIDFSFLYFCLTNQLVNEGQRKDAIRISHDLKGWESPASKDKVNSMLLTNEAMYYGVFYDFEKAFDLLEKAVALDSKNETAWKWLSDLYKEDGDFKKAEQCLKTAELIIQEREKPQKDVPLSNSNVLEEFDSLIQQFYNKRDIITTFNAKREVYSKLILSEKGIISQIRALLNDARNYFRGKDHHTPKELIPEIIGDVMEDLLEWMSLVSGVAYFKIHHNLGTDHQIEDLLEALLGILGWEEPHHLFGNAKKKAGKDFLREYKDQNENGLQDWEEAEEEEEYDNTFEEGLEGIDNERGEEAEYDFPLREGEIRILQETKEFGILPVRVIDYEDENTRNALIHPEEVVIPDEKCSILFSYPLSKKVVFEYENKGGFTRLDLFRCIYEGYKKIYEEEEQSAGDPGVGERCLNRKKSNGPYGIWGHYLEDLVIEHIYYNASTKRIDMFIGS